jgi:hypothetical protein
VNYKVDKNGKVLSPEEIAAKAKKGWTKERVATLDKKKASNLLKNAKARGASEIVEWCEEHLQNWNPKAAPILATNFAKLCSVKFGDNWFSAEVSANGFDVIAELSAITIKKTFGNKNVALSVASKVKAKAAASAKLAQGLTPITLHVQEHERHAGNAGLVSVTDHDKTFWVNPTT